MKRLSIGLLGIVAAVAAGTAVAQGPAGGTAPAAAPPSRGTAVFNVARVMKDYQKWQYFAATMNSTRAGKAAELAQIRNAMMETEQQGRVETLPAKKTELEQKLVGLQRTFEDKEKMVRKEIDDASAKHLQVLFAEIRTVVDAVAKTNGFELVLAYPDAMTEEEMKSPLYYDLKLRPPAAMPFYVSPSIDITMVVVQTLNKNFPAPGPVPAAPGVTATGGAGAPPPMK